MGNKVKYKQDLSLSENAAFVFLFLLPWLGIFLLIIRKKTLKHMAASIHDYLALVVSILYWGFLFSIVPGVLLAVVVAALGSLCFGMYLLLTEESSMNKWSITVGGVPIVILIYAMLLPLLSFDVASVMRNVPVSHLSICNGEIHTAGIFILIVIVHFVVAAKSFVSGTTLLSDYFDEIPDNEGLGLLLSFFGLIAVVIWPLINENVPNWFALVASCIRE